MARKAKADRKSRTLKKPYVSGADEAAPIPDRYRLVGIYERLRNRLLEDNESACLDQTLAYWVLPTDRRLPLALLDWQLSEVLACSLDELMLTPGIGQKKIMGLLDLLGRAANRNQKSDPFADVAKQSVTSEKRIFRRDAAHTPKAKRNSRLVQPTVGFDPELVSEEIWSTWCEAITRAGFKNQLLGRVAPCLRPLPTVIWEKKLEEYSSLRLAEIRQLKTHGEKRVQAILEVFFVIYEAVSTSVLNEHLELQIMPRFVPRLNDWLSGLEDQVATLSEADVKKNLVEPMLLQIEHDLGPSIADLARDRLIYKSKPPTILEHASKMRVTRARIYQLLEDCARVMSVRWPEGRLMLQPFLYALTEQPGAAASRLVFATSDLFFPSLTRSKHYKESIDRLP